MEKTTFISAFCALALFTAWIFWLWYYNGNNK